MHERRLHLHSMLVHAVLASVPVAAAAFVLEAAGATIGGIGPDVWRFLTRAALVVTLAAALPSTLSGVLERGHMYVTWHPTHRAKLLLSLALIVLVAVELAALLGGVAPGVSTGIAVVGANLLVGALLSVFGLKMTLGRQGLARLSYRPDLLKTPPVDVLAANADFVGEPPDVIDILQEMTP